MRFRGEGNGRPEDPGTVNRTTLAWRWRTDGNLVCWGKMIETRGWTHVSRLVCMYCVSGSRCEFGGWLHSPTSLLCLCIYIVWVCDAPPIFWHKSMGVGLVMSQNPPKLKYFTKFYFSRSGEKVWSVLTKIYHRQPSKCLRKNCETLENNFASVWLL